MILNKKLTKWSINDVELFWNIYNKNGKLMEEGFELLIKKFFFNEQEGWHMRIAKQPFRIQKNIFSMIYHHPKGEKFLREYPDKLGGRT